MSARKILTNTAAQIGGKLSTVLVSILLVNLLTNYFNTGEVGLYNKIYNYLSIFATLADAGLYAIAVRELSRCRDDREATERISGNVLAIRTASGAVIIALALGIALFLDGYNSPLALASIFVTGVFTLLGLVNSSILSLLQAHLDTGFSFVSTTVGKLANFAAIVAIIAIGFPKSVIDLNPEARWWAFVAVMAAGLLGNLVMTAMLWWHARGRYTLVWRYDRATAGALLRESAPYGLALVLGVIYFKVDVVMISLLEPASLADHSIGLYSVPMKILEVGIMFATLFLNSMLPVFSRAADSGDHASLARSARRAYLLLFALGAGLGAGLFAVGQDFLLVLATGDYVYPPGGGYSSYDVFRVSGAFFVFSFIGQLATFLLVSHKRQSLLLWINAIIALVNIAGNALLIPMYSFYGSAVMTVVSQGLLMAASLFFAWRVAGFRPPLLASAWLALGTILAVGVSPFVFSQTSTSALMRFAENSIVLATLLAIAYAPVLWREIRPRANIKSQ
jgi:O-antigen/teichoic acid export membrane protein